MTKPVKIAILLTLALLFAGCPGNLTTRYRTIQSASVLLFSFDENGVFPHTESFHRAELGVGVWPDSLSDSYELAQGFSLVRSAYATEPSTTIIYTNDIDSIHVYTLYEYDKLHPAGSLVNDILRRLDDMGNTEEMDISLLSGEALYFKFGQPPLNDSLQFEIAGRITNVGSFRLRTELVVLESE
ncbi:MAG: hypothetical protein R2751_09915 [Bacteroidales bacterium]